ncbi:MAG: hypothetical protein ACXAD7_03445 [Candidatus Kariarchaeaceae archaeon]|jgi:hypothetical protein
MIKIHLYGNLRELSSKSKPSDISILELPFVPGETLEKCINRVGISINDTGDLFVNHRLSDFDEIIPYDNSRIGIFPHNMGLLDGGLYIRYCGYRSSEVSLKSV